MMIKHYKDKNFEILISQELNGLYSATYLTNNNESNHQNMLDLESALDAFDFWYENHMKNEEKHD